MKSINNNQTQLRTLFIGVLCVVAGVMCFAQGFSHGSAEPAVSQSNGEQLGVSPPSVISPILATPQFTSLTPRYVTKRIADIEIGEEVVSRDPQSGEVTTKRVANVFRRVSDHLRILKVRNPETDELQTIETTNEHPFWVTARRDWIKAKDLNIGDHLDDVDGGQAILESTEFESHPDGIPVFNFEVEDFHNYYVRAHGSRGPPVLVHNADGYDILQTQILHITSPGINGLPGTGVFGDGVGSIHGSQYEPDIVYRALRREEIPGALENGLVAKNVNANFSPLDHVVDGSTEGFQSQFISATRDPRLAERWARRSGTAVVAFDLNKVGSPVLDLTTSAGRTQFLGDASRAALGSRLQTGNRLSKNASELLIRQSVSPSAIESITHFPKH